MAPGGGVRVSSASVLILPRREAAEISARKKSIVGILCNVAELGAVRMEEKIGKASLRDATNRNRGGGGQDPSADGANASGCRASGFANSRSAWAYLLRLEKRALALQNSTAMKWSTSRRD
jgi:hypothetical protein